MLDIFSTRIKDAGIAIRHSQGGIPFYTAGSRNGLGSRDALLKKKLNFQAVIKSAASAASPKTKIQGSLAVSVARPPSRRPLAPLDSWILVFGEAALAADFLTA